MSPEGKTRLYGICALLTCVVFFCRQYNVFSLNKVTILEKYSIVELYAAFVFVLQFIKFVWVGVKTGNGAKAMEPDMFGLFIILLINQMCVKG